MRIITARVDDPSLRGELESPLLIVEVDEWPDMTAEPDSLAGGWTISRYGPFVCYMDPKNEGEAGEFNVRFAGRFPPVVDIGLMIHGGDDECRYAFSLPLRRARQLVRKYESNWRLLVNDHDAQQGQLSWVPVETQPACREWKGDAICGRRPTRPVRINFVDLPLCNEHVQQNNRRYATERASAS